MKKRLLWIFPALVLLIAGGYLAFKIIRFNSISSEVKSFNKKIEDNYSNIGVFDDKLYYVDGNVLRGEKIDRVLFEKDLASGLNSIIYDKYIYLAYKDGKIICLDRFSGKERNRIDLGIKVEYFKKDGDRLIIYSDKAIISLDMKFSDKRERRFIHKSLDYSFFGDSYNSIYLTRGLDKIKSGLLAFEGDEEVFRLTSVDELFMASGYFTEKKFYAVTNRFLYLIENSSIIDKINLLKIRALVSDDKRLAIVDDQTLKVYDSNFDLLGQIELGFGANHIFLLGDAVICLGDDIISSYEKGNLIKNKLMGLKDYYKSDQDLYLIFDDRIERVRAD